MVCYLKMTVQISNTDCSIRAVIKMAQPDDKYARQDLKRERDVYHLPDVATSPYFRKMYDTVGDSLYFDNNTSEIIPSLALEWMELTLANLPYANVERSYTIVKAVIDAVLSSSVVLASQNRVDTGEAAISQKESLC